MKIGNLVTESRISREVVIDEFIENLQKAEESERTKGLRESEAKHKELLSSIRAACSAFRATCPDAWENFERGIVQLHGIAFVLDQRSPLDLNNPEQGAMVDSQQWALQKAYLQGQIKILDGILRTFNVDMVRVQEEFVRRQKAVETPKDFFQKSLTYFRNLLIAVTGSN